MKNAEHCNTSKTLNLNYAIESNEKNNRHLRVSNIPKTEKKSNKNVMRRKSVSKIQNHCFKNNNNLRSEILVSII